VIFDRQLRNFAVTNKSDELVETTQNITYSKNYLNCKREKATYKYFFSAVLEYWFDTKGISGSTKA